MNLFEAIFVRKSVRSYTNEGISPKVLEDILKQFDEINGLFGGVETELAILVYAMVIPEKEGLLKVLFEPSEHMVKDFRLKAPRKVFFD